MGWQCKEGTMASEKAEQTSRVRDQERFFQEITDERRVASLWYYRAREGIFGPFESMAAAESDLADLIYKNPQKREKFLK
jgi:hypothetical protein